MIHRASPILDFGRCVLLSAERNCCRGDSTFRFRFRFVVFTRDSASNNYPERSFLKGNHSQLTNVLIPKNGSQISSIRNLFVTEQQITKFPIQKIDNFSASKTTSSPISKYDLGTYLRLGGLAQRPWTHSWLGHRHVAAASQFGCIRDRDSNELQQYSSLSSCVCDITEIQVSWKYYFKTSVFTIYFCDVLLLYVFSYVYIFPS